MKKILSAVALLAGLASCGGPAVYENLGFEETVSAAGDKPFCIVLVDREQFLSREYVRILQEEHPRLARRAVFNIADIDEPANKWYLKWLCPVSVPLTCVFSPDGELIDLIPGGGSESFSHVEEAAGRMETTGYKWPNRFGMDKSRIVPILRDVLRNKRTIEAGVFIPRDAARSADSLRYPYSLNLKMTGQLMAGDTISARLTAEELLALETPYYMDVYNTEFISAHRTADPAFNIGNEPAIRVVPSRIDLGELPMGRPVPVDISVYNDGRKPLVISEVATDCSCLRWLTNGEVVEVAPRDSTVLSFALSPYADGEVWQKVLISSNAINAPLLNVNIVANFKPEPQKQE